MTQEQVNIAGNRLVVFLRQAIPTVLYQGCLKVVLFVLAMKC